MGGFGGRGFFFRGGFSTLSRFHHTFFFGLVYRMVGNTVRGGGGKGEALFCLFVDWGLYWTS